ncbi:hypothetical protein [Paenarthrobacter aurescens]|uniref:hypothetical protein n=1 Tax=Paenarthrobacter aurescens TaxID=43663 RepID=UPI0021BEF398|nr:hypothetical protein [Paenarthrobacter aurescens]MCT9869328.1 hypothetical protein [Paenarthrobacter aurescens]
MVVLPTMYFLGPVVGAIIVYLFLRMQVWSKPDAQSVASHGLWVGIIGWMASSLQGAMSAGIIRANPLGSSAPATPDQIANALAWPIVASLAVHALGQLSYPAPKAPRRYAELKVRRIGDFLPRKLAWTTAAIFGYAALAIAWIAALPAHAPVPPTPPGLEPPVDNGYMGQGQDGRIPGLELALWLGGSLLVLAMGTWLVLLLIARRRQLETLDGDDNRTLRTIATNRLLRTVATIAAGLATVAGNFASQPAPGVMWQSSWFNVLGLINMVLLLMMWWWRVPELPSLLKATKTTSAATLRADPRTHRAARLSISIGAALGMLGGLALVAGFAAILLPGRPPETWAFPSMVGLVAVVLLAAIAAGELLTAKNYGSSDAPKEWPRQPVSKGLLSFAIGSSLVLAVAVAFAVAGEVQPFGPKVWPAAVLVSVVVALAGAGAILAVRRRRGIRETGGNAGLDTALRAISMYRIVRTLAAYCLGQAAVLLISTGNAWYGVFPSASGPDPIGPSPLPTIGMVLAVIAVIVAVTPVRSLFRTIPRGQPAKQGEHAQ